MGTSLRRLLVIILRQPISISIQDGYVVVLFFTSMLWTNAFDLRLVQLCIPHLLEYPLRQLFLHSLGQWTLSTWTFYYDHSVL